MITQKQIDEILSCYPKEKPVALNYAKVREDIVMLAEAAINLITDHDNVGIPDVRSDVAELGMNDSVVIQSMAELARYADIGLAPNQIVELLSIALSLIRDGDPFEGDKIFIHINRLKKLLGSVE